MMCLLLHCATIRDSAEQQHNCFSLLSPYSYHRPSPYKCLGLKDPIPITLQIPPRTSTIARSPVLRPKSLNPTSRGLRPSLGVHRPPPARMHPTAPQTHLQARPRPPLTLCQPNSPKPHPRPHPLRL